MLQLYTNYRNYKKWPLLFSSKCSVFTCLFYIFLTRLKQQQILWMPCFLEDSVNWNTKNIPGVIFKTDTPMTFLFELLNTVLGSCNISCVYYSYLLLPFFFFNYQTFILIFLQRKLLRANCNTKISINPKLILIKRIKL